MFFERTDCAVSLLGVFRLSRGQYRNDSADNRVYDTISVRKEGISHFRSGGEKFLVEPGDVLYIPEKAKYTQQTEGELLYAVHFVSYNAPSDALEIMKPQDPERVMALLEKMWQEWEGRKGCYQYRANALFYELLELLSGQKYEEKVRTASSDGRLSKAVRYMYKNFRSPDITVAELAEQASYSEVYFRELFLRTFGIPPKKYIVNLRLEYAEQLLSSQLYSVQ